MAVTAKKIIVVSLGVTLLGAFVYMMIRKYNQGLPSVATPLTDAIKATKK